MVVPPRRDRGELFVRAWDPRPVTAMTTDLPRRAVRRRWPVLAGTVVAVLVVGLLGRAVTAGPSAPERWTADAVAPSSGAVTVLQAPPGLGALSKSPVEDDPLLTYSVSDTVVGPDGTVWTMQDRRYSEIDNQSLRGWDSRGRALLALRPDGTVEVVESPYDGNDEGVRPLCTAGDGTLFGRAEATSAVVARSPDGTWREVTGAFVDRPSGEAPRNDGGLATETVVPTYACAVEADGDLLVLDSCTVRRIDAAGVLTTIAGLDTAAGFGSCGEADSRERSTPGPEPLLINGPATAADLPYLEDIAVGPDGSVWLGSPVALRALTEQPDGTYVVQTVQTRAYGAQEDVVWSVTPDALTDIAPLDDGRVLVLTQTNLLVLGVDGVLRGTDRRDHRHIAVRNGELLSVGPVPDGGDGLRVARIPT